MIILIVGSDANACSIAEKISKNPNVDVVFMTSSDKVCNCAQNIDIAENEIEELLDFAIANEVSFTVVTSVLAIENNIAELFADARQQIFAPYAQSAAISIYNSVAKKTMYRLKIPTMKFGIFERECQAVEYASKSRKTLVIKNDTHILGEHPVFASTFKQAKSAIERCFSYPDNKVIIEDCIDASKAALYFITDGYTALPIGSVCPDEIFGWTDEIYSPDRYISDELEMKILREVIYPVIDDLSSRSLPYCGILGVDLLVQEDSYNVVEFLPFFKPIHLQAILPLIKTDLTDLFLSAACGSLSDEYDRVEFNNLSSFTKVSKPVDNAAYEALDDKQLSFVNYNKHSILTQCAATSAKAREFLFENISFLQQYEVEDE